MMGGEHVPSSTDGSRSQPSTRSVAWTKVQQSTGSGCDGVGLAICVKSSGPNTAVKVFHVQPPTPTPRHPGDKTVALGRPTSGGHLLAFLGLIPDADDEKRVSSRKSTHRQGTVVARQPSPRLVPGPVLMAYRHTVCGPAVVGIVKV